MDTPPLCPDWWPKNLWDLHFPPHLHDSGVTPGVEPDLLRGPRPDGGHPPFNDPPVSTEVKIGRWNPGPINYPPAIDAIMAALSAHTFSYLMLDEKAAQQIRDVAEQSIVNIAQNLSRLHDEHHCR